MYYSKLAALFTILLLVNYCHTIYISSPSYSAVPPVYNPGDTINIVYSDAQNKINSSIDVVIFNSQQANADNPLVRLTHNISQASGSFSLNLPSVFNPPPQSSTNNGMSQEASNYCGYYICVGPQASSGCEATSGSFCIRKPQLTFVTPRIGQVFILGNLENGSIPVSLLVPGKYSNSSGSSDIQLLLRRHELLSQDTDVLPAQQITLQNKGNASKVETYSFNIPSNANISFGSEYYFCVKSMAYSSQNLTVCEATSSRFTITPGAFLFTSINNQTTWTGGSTQKIAWNTTATFRDFFTFDVRRSISTGQGSRDDVIGSVQAFQNKVGSVSFNVPTRGIVNSCQYYVCLYSTSGSSMMGGSSQSGPSQCAARSSNFCIQRMTSREGLDLSQIEPDIQLVSSSSSNGNMMGNTQRQQSNDQTLRTGLDYTFSLSNIKDIDLMVPYVVLLASYSNASLPSSSVVVLANNITLTKVQQDSSSGMKSLFSIFQAPTQNGQSSPFFNTQQMPSQSMPQQQQQPGIPSQNSDSGEQARFSICLPTNVTSGRFFLCVLNNLEYNSDQQIFVPNCTFVSSDFTVLNVPQNFSISVPQTNYVGRPIPINISESLGESIQELDISLVSHSEQSQDTISQSQRTNISNAQFTLSNSASPGCNYFLCVNIARGNKNQQAKQSTTPNVPFNFPTIPNQSQSQSTVTNCDFKTNRFCISSGTVTVSISSQQSMFAPNSTIGIHVISTMPSNTRLSASIKKLNLLSQDTDVSMSKTSLNFSSGNETTFPQHVMTDLQIPMSSDTTSQPSCDFYVCISQDSDTSSQTSSQTPSLFESISQSINNMNNMNNRAQQTCLATSQLFCIGSAGRCAAQ